MRARFILSETWANLTRNLSMLLSLTLVTFISFLFIGASVLTQAQITKAQPIRELRFRQIALSQ